MHRPSSALSVGFLDLILISLICIVAILALIQINPDKRKPPAIETTGKFLIVIQWNDVSADDVDLYVRDPAGRIIFYRNRDIGLMHLEHDDLGTVNDTMMSTGGEVRIERNEERAVLRGTVPGEYIVNVHMYRKRDFGPTEVTVVLYRLIGMDRELARRTRVLVQNGDEKTAFRFTVTEGEKVRNINDLPYTIVRKALDGNGRPVR